MRDFETGNYYMRARYYNPDTGRFISEDPIKDGSNWYSYCGGNPVMFFDCIGLAPTELRSWVNDKVNGLSYITSTITWDSTNKVARVSMSNEKTTKTTSFTIGENGSYIENNRIFVDDEDLWKNFGLIIDPPIEINPIRDTIIIAITLTVAIKVGSSVISSIFKSTEITNEVIQGVRTGSALKLDPYHSFNDIIDNYVGYAEKTNLVGGDGITRTLYKLEGSLNGVEGVFEWILNPNNEITHRFFRPN